LRSSHRPARRRDRHQAEPGHQRRRCNSKDIQDKFAANGFAIDPGTPEALAQRNKAETAKWAKAIRDAKIEQQ
jgi:tripartite-type tricarboxylate transporter receptor subunit TctC